jgi:hypothetical protein
MKKTLLLFVVLIASAGLSAQVLLQQDFSSGIMPPTGWMVFGNQSNWDIAQSNTAGGTIPECRVKSTPAFNGSMRFISPSTNTSGLSQVIIQFKHMFDHVDGNTTGVVVSVETRATSSGTWHEVWSKNATTDVSSETVTALVNNTDVGSGSFQFCLKITGSSQNFKDWFIDDILLLDPLTNDAGMASISVPVMFVTNQVVSGKIVNVGETAINSANVSWTTDGSTVHTTSLTGLNVATGSEFAYSCTDSIIANPGVYDLKVWVSNLNGSATPDDNPANDTLVKNISVPTHLVYRRPMYEEFTSSTCSPFASFNNSTFNPFIAAHGNEITLVKYQMNWPGAGDPYYTAEGGARRAYYGVNAVPDLYVDGKVCATNSTGVNNAFNTSKNTLTYLEIQSSHEIQGNNVIIDCNILPYANYTGVTIQIAVVERKTTQNVATNGETEFHNVMMKMVPDATGTLVNLTADQPYNLKYTMDMTGTNVEEMNDLMVAIFVQASNKEILNSNYSTETGSMIVSMTPADGSANVPVNAPMVITYHQPIRMKDGSAVTNNNVASVLTLKENNANGANAGFTATVNAAKTVITVTPNPNLNYSQQYYLKVDTLENNQGVNTFAMSSTFTTELSTVNMNEPKISSIVIYPNPASERIYIKSNEIGKISRIEMLNTIGKTVRIIEKPSSAFNEISINVSDLPSGIYFVRALGDGNAQTMRVLISR